MLFWLGIVVAILVVAVLANAVGLYVRYCLSPEKKWRARVERRMADAENRLRAERRELEDARVGLEKEETAIRRRALDTFLKSCSVAELEAYPGIGSGTVSKLSGAGFTNLAKLQDARIRVPGLGTKRLLDIKNAVRALVKQARSQFEASACREAQDLSPQSEAARAKHAQREYLLHARLASVEAVVATMRPLLTQARKVTFFRYLRRQSDPAVPDKLRNSPLPDLEETIQLAVDRAAAEYAGHCRLPVANGQTGSTGAQPRPEAVPVASEELFQQALASAAPLTPSLAEATGRRELLDLDRLEVTVEFAYAVARADGRIARKEKEIIEQHIQTRFGNDLALLNRARAFCTHYESAAIDLTRCLQRITNLFTADEHRALFDFATEIADATGQRNQREVEFLEKVAGKLGILKQSQTMSSPAPVREAKPAIPATREERLALLEIDAAAPLSADLVRRQFNLLSQRYAPDKFESMGSEFVTVAENKRAALLAAATALLELWGEKLEPISPPSQPQELRHNHDLDVMFGA
jgi:uncharacterized tellurite resistance protein B-like protein